MRLIFSSRLVKMMILSLFFIIFSWYACSEKKVTAMKVNRKEISLPPSAVKHVGGFFGTRIQANKENYLKTFDIDRYTHLLEEKTYRDWSWKEAEQPGKWLDSAVRAGLQSSDPELLEKARQILDRIQASQDQDGYVGVTDPAVRTNEQPLRGMDPYELYFLMHGLLTNYEYLGNQKALQTAERLGDYFINNIGLGKAEFWPSEARPPEHRNKELHGHSAIAGHSVHYGWEGTLLIDPMLRMYQIDGQTKYLEWTRWVISNIDKWSGHDAFSRLDQVAAGTMGIHEVQPYVHAHTFHMNFLGFLRMYQITGEESYLKKVQGAWHDIASRQMYITGGVSVGEHYEPNNNLPIVGHVVETCASMSWIELSQYLLELSEDPVYADAIEKLLLNHLFAAQTVDGDCNRYFTPLNGVKPKSYFHGPDCCTGSGHRIVARIPSLIYALGKNTIYVNQYLPSSLETNLNSKFSVILVQETEYPSSDKIILKISPDKKSMFSLKLRIPAWCKNASVKVNGVEMDNIVSGTYAVIEREWQSGDQVELNLPMTIEWIAGEYNTAGLWALRRGPVVYSLDTIWWEKFHAHSRELPENLAEFVTVDVKAEPVESEAPAGTLGPALTVPVKTKNSSVLTAPMLPFANTGVWYRNPVTRPDKQSAAFAYAVWLPARKY